MFGRLIITEWLIDQLQPPLERSTRLSLRSGKSHTRGDFLDTRSRNLRLLLLQLRQMSFGSERYIIKRSVAIYRMVDRPAPTDAGADPPHLRLRCSDLTCRGSNF